MRDTMGIGLGILRLGAHCVGKLSAVGRIGTEIRILVLCILWSPRGHGTRVNSLSFGSRYDLRLGIPIAASVTWKYFRLRDAVACTVGEGNVLH